LDLNSKIPSDAGNILIGQWPHPIEWEGSSSRTPGEAKELMLGNAFAPAALGTDV
jgi:hypothetical protein